MVFKETKHLNYLIPDIINGKFIVDQPQVKYTTRGIPSSFSVKLTFLELNLSKTLKSSDFYILQEKIESLLLGWGKNIINI